MDFDYLKILVKDTDEKLMRVGEDVPEGLPKAADTYEQLLSDLMCRLIEHLDIPNVELANYWHTTADCNWPVLPEFVKDD